MTYFWGATLASGRVLPPLVEDDEQIFQVFNPRRLDLGSQTKSIGWGEGLFPHDSTLCYFPEFERLPP